jgi:hypothetical protein
MAGTGRVSCDKNTHRSNPYPSFFLSFIFFLLHPLTMHITVLWQKMGCFNKAISEFDKEMSTFSDDYRRVMSLPKKQKITGICCRFLAFEERIIGLAKRTCDQSHSDYFARFLKDYSSDVGDLLCSGITTKSDSCKKLVLPESSNQQLEKTMSFIPPLLQILSQL